MGTQSDTYSIEVHKTADVDYRQGFMTRTTTVKKGTYKVPDSLDPAVARALLAKGAASKVVEARRGRKKQPAAPENKARGAADENK